MSFPNRAIIMAPVARDLFAEHHDHWIAKIPGATNGVNQLWDTLDQDFWTSLNDAQLTIWGTWAAVPLAAKKYCIRALRYDDVGCTLNPHYVLVADLVTGDYWKLVAGGVRDGAAQAGDRPLEWVPAHEWCGNVDDTLGSP